MPEGRPTKLAPVLAALALFAAGCPAGEPVLRVQGTVLDRSAHPVENVSVALRAEGRLPHLSTTDSAGEFQTSIVGASRATVTFSKDGFRPVDATVNANAPPLHIVLQPVTPAP